MTAAKQIELVSIADYLAGKRASEVKHTYPGGYMYATAGARNVHIRIAVALYGCLHTQLRGKPREPFNSDAKVRLQLPTHTRF